MDIVCKEESYAIMGACFEVHREMGCGFLEAVYQECLGIEFGLQNIPFREHGILPLTYKLQRLTQVYQPNFLCFDKLVLEIKAVSAFTDIHRAQVHNYLKATGYHLGILVDFNCDPKMEWERIAN